MNNVAEVFSEYNQYLSDELQIKEKIRDIVTELEATARQLSTELQVIHQCDEKSDQILAACQSVEAKMNVVQAKYKELEQAVPANHYYRYYDHWRFCTQRFVFILSISELIQRDQILSREDACRRLGLKKTREEGFHLDLEDFLVGLLLLANELSRWSVNAVTAGDYSRPVRILKLLKELHSGFQLLHMKNDQLRKRYDALKYDLKKVEEVVYDLTIRGLVRSS